jgi:malate synthase
MTSTSARGGSAVLVGAELRPRFDEILTPDALDFVAELTAAFAPRRAELLRARAAHYAAGQPGRSLTFLEETAAVRADKTWRVTPPAPGLADRRCEITGPTSRKMTINALNSGATVWMADFEDATSPTWFNVVDGQLNLYDAIRRQIDFTDSNGKRYEVGESTPTILVRPRGWHLDEKHLTLDGAPLPGAFVDFGLFFFHNAQALIEAGAGPYFYLPKMESHLEARLWNEVFSHAQQRLDIPYGTIRATCLIETTPAAFEMEEILCELRDHSAGLNAGRWDYIFSMIKNFADDPGHLLPDRSRITMTSPFMAAYASLLVKTCHARGAHAIGGMAAFVPSKQNQEATAAALATTTADKKREASQGFDGSWVAHPDLVPSCTAAFTEILGERPNQLDRQRDDITVAAAELVDVSTTEGLITLQGLRTNLRVSLEYLAAWIGGTGAVAIDHLMEDAATVEISRMQTWQWIRHAASTADGTPITRPLVAKLLDEQIGRLADGADDARQRSLAGARDILEHTCLVDDWPQFVTSYAYDRYLVGATH